MVRRTLLVTDARPRFEGFGPWKLAPQLPRARDEIILAEELADARKQFRKHVPLEPGVYGMVNSDGELVYVGQSHALRDRLLSYVGASAPDKAKRIIAHTYRLLWETVPDAFAAPLRELELIRRWRPRFNVRGQPGRKRAAYVVVGQSPAPHAYLTSQLQSDEKAVFGPLRGTRIARRAVELLNDYFRLRTCSKRVAVHFSDNSQLFPADGEDSMPPSAQCMRYDLGLCLGPCAGLTSRRQYSDHVRAAINFLRGDDTGPFDQLRDEMHQAANVHQYERAAATRDLFRALEYLRNQIYRLRDARQNYRFVYPLAGTSGRPTWYFIHRGQVIGATAEPRTAKEHAACASLLARLEDANSSTIHDDADDDFEMQWLVSFWFRRHPDALTKTVSQVAARRALSRYS